ncbi:efflux RND transporter periplasmic adaptor subunit [candidate division KSB1 bacterium]|nr:efflux RND transporter periplasmic adaptor subunit [candidate division KSB1 bacterium]
MKKLLGFLLFLLACQNQSDLTTTDLTVPVKTAAIQQQPLVVPVRCSGLLQTAAELKLSFKTGGIIDRIYADEGDRIKKGESLAVLQLDEIEAQLSQATSALQKGRRDFERVKNLYADNAVTLEQFQDAETALQVARSQLQIAEFNYRHSRIIAPANGIILKKLAEAHEMIAPGHPVIIFGVRDNAWLVKAGIIDRDVVRLVLNDSAAVVFDVYADTLAARVTNIATAPRLSDGLYEIDLKLLPTSKKLLNGFIAEVMIYPALRRRLKTIPFASLVESDGKKGYVFTIMPDSTAKRCAVVIEHIQNDRVFIHSGLEGIDRVVTKGSAYLTDSSKVNVVDTQPGDY